MLTYAAWSSDSHIAVVIAPGVGFVSHFLLSIINIEIDFKNAADAGRPSFVYNRPSLLSVTTNCPAAGGGVLTIIGENFGTTPIGWDGAGWGGCAISLVPSDKVGAFIEYVAANYYAKLADKPTEQSSYLFATGPSTGARALDFCGAPDSDRLSHNCVIA